MEKHIKTWGPRLIVAAAMLVLLYELGQSAWLFVQHDWKAITFRYPLDYGEGPLLDQSIRLARF